MVLSVISGSSTLEPVRNAHSQALTQTYIIKNTGGGALRATLPTLALIPTHAKVYGTTERGSADLSASPPMTISTPCIIHSGILPFFKQTESPTSEGLACRCPLLKTRVT